MNLIQSPNLGQHILLFRGDIVTFSLKSDKILDGSAYLRTNMENSSITQKEIIKQVSDKRAAAGQGWHNIPMMKISENEFKISLSLLEVGHFEAICYFVPGEFSDPIWPGSENVCINVEPAEYFCANSIYCAFVRQFGPNKNYQFSKPISGISNVDMLRFDKEDFTIIPPSGKFRDLIKELDFIIGTLNCRIIHLLPINPTPTVYGRMGRYGSPYASLDFSNIDPALAEFDTKATPLEQFTELVDAIHARDAKLIIDVAINHTGWAAKLHEEHPEWLIRKNDGTIVSPGAWGVTWGDLTELDHNHQDLWEYLANMFLIWTSRGVDGFRCDAGYMIPYEAWKYIIAKVRQQYPYTIFLLEGLGGDPQVTFKLLNKANMNWAYSELFQNYSKRDIINYVQKSFEIGKQDGLLVNYAETHDNSRLASISNTYARMRTGVCSLLSSNGAFGFTNGVEWFAKEKIDVHEASALNWGAKENQIDFIANINNLLISHPAFYRGATLKFIDNDNENVISAIRTDEHETRKVLILINLNCDKKNEVSVSVTTDEFNDDAFYDLISGETYVLTKSCDKINFSLVPGEVRCFSSNEHDLEIVLKSAYDEVLNPDRIHIQKAKALALSLLKWINGSSVIFEPEKVELYAEKITKDPVDFFKQLTNDCTDASMITWHCPKDFKRKVILPPSHVMLIQSKKRFRIKFNSNGKVISVIDGILSCKGYYFNFFIPIYNAPKKHKLIKMDVSLYDKKECEKSTAELLLLTSDVKELPQCLSNEDIRRNGGVFLSTNGIGGMIHSDIRWGEISSKYNAVLAANLDKNVPVDRHIMLTRFRCWAVVQGRSTELKIDNTEKFFINSVNGGTWRFHVPVGNGLYSDLSISLKMHENKNISVMTVYRHKADGKSDLFDSKELRLVIRPDIEDRSFHNNTVINNDLYFRWQSSVIPKTKGFDFNPSGARKLNIESTFGSFVIAPELQKGIYHQIESERGMDAYCDLFSPGYFRAELNGGESFNLFSSISLISETIIYDVLHSYVPTDILKEREDDIESIFINAVKDFVVKRDELKTVIAGYPWFLDWGRDTLICVRGMIAAGMTDDVKKILLQFGKFIENGTLPNIIHGNSVGNRDTADAQLWFFVACSDYCYVVKNQSILNDKIDTNRTLLDGLKSIISGYINGTPNGIKADNETGLVFTPSHFTWMDTNYPAGTPREGYAIEIQALWHFALKFIFKVSGEGEYEKLAKKVKSAVLKFYVKDEVDEDNEKTGRMFLSDCLHCSAKQLPENALADDHNRPNQLFAVTLGLVEEKKLCSSILESCFDLVIPGAIRTLDDKKTIYQLPIKNGNAMLNDPESPYWGKYEGDEDNRRKPAYHNGTAWTWVFPSYSEAYYLTHGSFGKSHSISILSSVFELMKNGCFMQLPEILDGDYPHKQRGCDAQAWGITEVYRVWKMLH